MTGKKGFTLVEVIVSLVILGIVALAAMQSLSFVSNQSRATKDKTFAAQKCIQLMEELRGISQTQSMDVIDGYNDDAPSTILTLRVVLPSDPLSGNKDGRFERLVTIERVPGQPDARRAGVKIYKAGPARELLAESVNFLRRSTGVYPPSQVYDVYLLSLENAMASWTNIAELKPALDTVLNDFKIRNPGLEFRSHLISRLSIGRDPFYAPSLNVARESHDPAAFPGIYLYPSKVYDNHGGYGFTYFDANNMAGRHRKDNQPVLSPLADGRPPMADHYNHALRYPDERDAALAAGLDPREGTWRLLLENMSKTDDHKDDHKNAIFLNLHGEVIPLPPLRNYSDPAKDPENVSGVRVVTHPEWLWNEAHGGHNKNEVRLRVYSYYVSTGAALDGIDRDSQLDRDIVVRLPGVSSSDVDKVRFLNEAFVWADAGARAVVDASIPGETRVRLKNSPLRHQGAAAGSGLDPDARLYGWEYIPCLVSGADFAEGARDLADGGTSVPKNTARWVIEIKKHVLADQGSREFRVETWIQDPVAALAAPPPPAPNLSRTFFWVSPNEESVPVTEQYQLMGDPRHMPYADVKRRHGYNWYFPGPPLSATDYPDFDRFFQNVHESPPRPEGWTNSYPDHVPEDVPRYHQLLRTALMHGHSVFGNIAGGVQSYFTVGGEWSLGNWGNGAHNGIPLSRFLVTAPTTDTSMVNVDESAMDISGNEHHLRLIQRRDDSWTCFPWLGELYPDDRFGAPGGWKDLGNLPVADYYRAHYGPPFFGVKASIGTGVEGSISLFGGNSLSSGDRWFQTASVFGTHDTAEVTTDGKKAAGQFNLSLPPLIKLAAGFSTNQWTDNHEPPEWDTFPYDQRHLVKLIEKYIEDGVNWETHTPPAGTNASAGLLTVTPPGTTAQGPAAHFVLNCLAEQLGFGPTQISRIALTNVLRGFLRLGGNDIKPAGHGWIRPLPRVELEAPKDEQEYDDPSEIEARWTTQWALWNGFDYTEYNVPPYDGPLSDLLFNVKYSSNGTDWICAATGLASTPRGEYDGDCNVPVSASPATFVWSVPADSFPKGRYHLLVEAHTKDRRNHYAYHRARVYILR
jgi:prepilin-type N-terminal cleavage/methylation domain-containing protein